MSKRIPFPVLACLLPLLAGCGPSVTEMRMVAAPPRGESCDLEFLQLKMTDLTPGMGIYELLGNVSLHQTGVQDPFQQKYKDIVRPRACAMGGEGVTILTQATATSMLGSGSSVIYAVVRKRPAPGAAAPPQKF